MPFFASWFAYFFCSRRAYLGTTDKWQGFNSSARRLHRSLTANHRKLLLGAIIMGGVLTLFLSMSAFAQEVVVIKLRTPHTTSDARFDPYYDLGTGSCFGATGCHKSNLMNPEKVESNLVGKRAAFVQQGFDPTTGISQQRMVFLTQVIESSDIEFIGEGKDRTAVLHWDGLEFHPLKFGFAPVLVGNDGGGIEELVKDAQKTARSSPVAGFGSLFRTRTKALSTTASRAVISAWEKAIKAGAHVFAEHYWETMNPPPGTIDSNREASFQSKARRWDPNWTPQQFCREFLK